MPNYDYPRPALTVDLVVIAGRPDDRSVLLVRRAAAPFKDRWALPGGFVDEDEPLEARQPLGRPGQPPADGVREVEGEISTDQGDRTTMHAAV